SAGHERRKADLPHLKLRDRGRGLEHVLRAGASRYDAVANEFHGGEAGEQRAIEIEERAGRGAGRTLENLARQVRIGHAPSPRARAIAPVGRDPSRTEAFRSRSLSEDDGRGNRRGEPTQVLFARDLLNAERGEMRRRELHVEKLEVTVAAMLDEACDRDLRRV